MSRNNALHFHWDINQKIQIIIFVKKIAASDPHPHPPAKPKSSPGSSLSCKAQIQPWVPSRPPSQPGNKLTMFRMKFSHLLCSDRERRGIGRSALLARGVHGFLQKKTKPKIKKERKGKEEEEPWLPPAPAQLHRGIPNRSLFAAPSSEQSGGSARSPASLRSHERREGENCTQGRDTRACTRAGRACTRLCTPATSSSSSSSSASCKQRFLAKLGRLWLRGSVAASVQGSAALASPLLPLPLSQRQRRLQKTLLHPPGNMIDTSLRLDRSQAASASRLGRGGT